MGVVLFSCILQRQSRQQAGQQAQTSDGVVSIWCSFLNSEKIPRRNTRNHHYRPHSDFGDCKIIVQPSGAILPDAGTPDDGRPHRFTSNSSWASSYRPPASVAADACRLPASSRSARGVPPFSEIQYAVHPEPRMENRCCPTHASTAASAWSQVRRDKCPGRPGRPVRICDSN